MKKHRGPSQSSASQTPESIHSPGAGSNQAVQDELLCLVEREPDHPILNALGEAFGLGAGFVVTELLALVPSWSQPLENDDGSQVSSVKGASRIGDNPLEKRHTQFVGPKIESYAATLNNGALKDFLTGVGEGATDAPGASYRVESAVSDHIDDTWGSQTGG